MALRPDPRAADWLDIVAHLLTDTAREWPADYLAGQLRTSFGSAAVCWSESLQSTEVRMTPATMLADLPLDEWIRTGRLQRHPLLRWHAVSNDPQAQSTARIPAAVVSRRDVIEWQEIIRRYGLGHELSIPLLLDGRRHLAFVLARAGEDFSDADVALARRLQPVLIGLERQTRVFARHPATLPLGQHRLTARELAVLSLLASGMTASGIAHRLAISPRTVHKHLEHLYEKLSATDKVSAIRRAERAGILPQPDESRTPAAARGVRAS